MKPSPEAIERHAHLGDELPAGWIRVDFHSHTMWSGDCTTTPDELVESVQAAAIDVLCITDHNEVVGAQRLKDELSCRVVVGEEVRVGQGEIIGLFLEDRIPAGLSPVQAAQRIRDQGGLVYVPHPFDPMRNCLSPAEIDELNELDLLDGIEGWNAKTSLASLNRRAADYGEVHGLWVGAGSDAHVPDALGAAYLQMPDVALEGPGAAQRFAAAARHGRVVGHHYDAPRRWSARIVPSVYDG